MEGEIKIKDENTNISYLDRIKSYLDKIKSNKSLLILYAIIIIILSFIIILILKNKISALSSDVKLKHYDYLIVGSGLYGATFNYLAKKAGKTTYIIIYNKNRIF